MMAENKIYFDYASTTPLDPRVKEVIFDCFENKFGNPGSLHSFGRESLKVIDESREKIAKSINAGFREVIFTGSATEANNMALRGVVRWAKNQKSNIKNPKIIISNIEHPSVFETAKHLENEGVEVAYIPADRKGFVDLDKLKSELNENTILVSVMYANNEIGTIEPIKEISGIIKEFQNSLASLSARRAGAKLEDKSFTMEDYPIFHCDAVQAFQYLDCDVENLGVDLMTLSAHKVYGPKGIGALYMKNSKFKTQNLRSSLQLIEPIVTGGGQEFGFRSGTENTPLIAGFAKAVELANLERKDTVDRISKLGEYFCSKMKEKSLPAVLNGPAEKFAGNFQSLPGILNFTFPGKSSEETLIKLDMAGIAVSSGSACSARSTKPSRTLQAIGLLEKSIKSSLRFSLGRFTAKNDIDEFFKRANSIFKA